MMNDDQYLLASAYADGELTPVERALAEADPAVMAEVERLQALRGALRDVAPPTEAARTAMIAAAMREFHAAAEAAPVTAPAVTHRRPARRFNWERSLGIAAAAIAVVAIGAVIATGTRGGGDDDSADMAEGTIATDPADAASTLSRAAGQDVTLETPADTAAAASTEAPAVMAEPSEGAPDATAETVAADGTSAAVGPVSESSVIESPEELAAAGVALRDEYAAAQLAGGDDTTATTAAGNECTFTAAVESPEAIPEAEQLRDELPELAERVELLAVRDYRIGPDHVRPALIAVDVDTGRAFAIEPAGCSLLAVGPRP